MRIALLILVAGLSVFASPANNKIQEAAYILATGADTVKAEQLLHIALGFSDISEREKLSAHLYLAKVSEEKGEYPDAIEHYAFLKNNSQNISLAYTAAEKEKLLGVPKEKIRISTVKKHFNQKQTYKPIQPVPGFSNCIAEGEIRLAQHTVYNCPDKNSLLLVSKSKGTETWSISYKDKPAKVFLVFDGFFLYSENSLYFYRIGEDLNVAVWRISTLEVQDIEDVGDNIYVLDISGKITLLNKNSGLVVSSASSDGENFFKPGTGLIGTYQRNGGISVFDTLLNNLWDYQIDGEIAEPPFVKSDSVIFNLQNGKSEILYTRHYYKIKAPQNESTDSLLAFESGNALAWYSIAEHENSDSAWKRAVIYGSRKPEISSLIFAGYAKKTGAKWVRHLPISSKMLYPRIFSDANSLFVYDFGSQNLLRFYLESGGFAGNIPLPKDKKYIVADDESPWLIMNSDHSLLGFSLKEQKSVSLDIIGKPFSFLRSKDSMYVGLWNGFVQKYFMPEMRPEWSNKVSSAPVLLSKGEKGVYSLSKGRIALLSPKMRIDEGKEINLVGMGDATYFKYKNKMFAAALEDGNVQIFSESEEFEQLGTFFVPSPIVSFELLQSSGKTYALAGGANQIIYFYEIPSGALVWTFNSKGSAYMNPVLHGSNIWLDQDDSIVAIDINSGKTVKKYPILGSGASISIYGNTLYCSTPQKLLYAFPL